MTTTNKFRESRLLWPAALSIITLIALFIRWYYVSSAIVDHPIRGDATQYFSYAWNLVHNGVFSKDPPGSPLVTPDNYRDPGYPLLLGMWMKMLGTGSLWYSAVLLCQAALGALTVTLATQLGRLWLPTGWAICSGVLMAVWPHSVAINGYLLTETLFGFLCALGILLCATACRLQNLWLAFGAGLVMGAAALTNAIFLPFGILLAVFLAWRKLTSRRICAALAIGALIFPGLWSIRNVTVAAPGPNASSLDRALQNLAQGASPNYHEAYRDSISGDAQEQASARTVLDRIDHEYELLRIAPEKGAEAIMQRMAQRPLRYATWYLLQKPYALWDWDIQIGQGDIYVYPTMNSPFKTQHTWIALEVICQSLNPILMFLALASLLALRSRKAWLASRPQSYKRTALVMVVCLVAFVTLVYGMLQAEPRYSIPFRSFEILLAITSCAEFARWRHQRSAAVAQPAIDKVEGIG